MRFLLSIVVATLLALDGFSEVTSAADWKNRVEKLSIRTGLSQNSANRIVMDRQGFLWIATQDGLNRFDGYSFRVFRPDPEDSLTLDDGFIFDMKSDRDGQIWLLTSQGVNQFDPITEKVVRWNWLLRQDTTFVPTHLIFLMPVPGNRVLIGATDRLYEINTKTRALRVFSHSAQDKSGLPDLRPTAVLVDQSDRIWVATNRGLSLFDPANGQFRLFNGQASDGSGSVFNGRIFGTLQDSNGKIWVMTSSGLKWFDSTTGIYHSTSIVRKSEDEPTFAEMVEGHDGNLWIGTYGNGVLIYNPITNQLVGHLRGGSSDFNLSSDIVNSIYHDPAGMIWIGTDGYGLNKTDSRPVRFYSISARTHPLGDPVTMAVLRERNVVWQGSYGGGLARVNLTTGKTDVFRAGSGHFLAPNTDRVMAIAIDSSGWVWVGTDNAGLSIHNPNTGEVIRYRPTHTGPTQFPALGVYRFYSDRDQRWLVATNDGVYQFNRQERRFIRFGPVPKNQLVVNSLLQASDGSYYYCTDFGLIRFATPDSNTFTRFLSDPGNPASLSHNTINDIHEDFKGRIWIATSRGLTLFNPENQTFLRYFDKSGLPSSFIYGVLPDRNGNLWMSTNSGLVRFHPDAGKLQSLRFFDEADGILSNEFNQGAFYFHETTQSMYFGGLEGISWFYPLDITDNPNPPRVSITAARILDEPINLLPYQLSGETLAIDSRDYFFSIEFSALDFVNPSRNNYMYKLEGFDKDWVMLGNRRFVTFTNLDAGSYTLLIRASNSDGVWNETGTSLEIEIVPPFYKTRWFIGLVALTVIGLIVLWVRYRAAELTRRNLELERLVEARTAELKLSQEQLIHTEKMRVIGQLASGIAHDINNVLSIILGSANLLNKKFKDPGLNRQLTIIEKASMDGAYIISQLQEFSRQTADDRVTGVEINSLLEDVMDMTQYRMNERRKKESVQISFNRQLMSPSPLIYGNQAELRASFTNLVLNAIDAYRSDGTITIQTSQPTDTEVEVRILDDAIGMDDATVRKIFEPFFTTKGVKGSGLGLSQVFGAVSRHRGTIDVKSKPGYGTEFIIRFPAYTQKDERTPLPETLPAVKKGFKGQVLIIEDEEDIRNIYTEILTDLGIKGLYAPTGEEGLTLWNLHRPVISLIISDIGLPGISGWDVIAEIRKEQTSIPILVVTGWGNEISSKQIESMKVNKVISKPFTIGQLIKEIQAFISPEPN